MRLAGAALDRGALAAIDRRPIGLEPPVLRLLRRGDFVDEFLERFVATEVGVADISEPRSGRWTGIERGRIALIAHSEPFAAAVRERDRRRDDDARSGRCANPYPHLS